jgi:hypothetical protein
MAVFLMAMGLVLILVARGAGKRRRNAKATERAVLKALRKARAEACPVERGSPPVGRIILWALAAALILGVVLPALAQTPSLTCETSGSYRHCFNHQGYDSTEQQSPGGYVHGWDNRGHAWTTWDHNGVSTTWTTR